MPYLNDPRRTVTLNLQPDEYAALAEDALEAGYATPGTYAKALVLARGAAPAPIRDERSADRLHREIGKTKNLRWQLEREQTRHDAQQQKLHDELSAMQAQLAQAQQELVQRPPLWQIEQLTQDSIAQAVAVIEAARNAPPPAPTGAAATSVSAPTRTRRAAAVSPLPPKPSLSAPPELVPPAQAKEPPVPEGPTLALPVVAPMSEAERAFDAALFASFAPDGSAPPVE